jgi:hypothetical protein
MTDILVAIGLLMIVLGLFVAMLAVLAAPFKRHFLLALLVAVIFSLVFLYGES